MPYPNPLSLRGLYSSPGANLDQAVPSSGNQQHPSDGEAYPVAATAHSQATENHSGAWRLQVDTAPGGWVTPCGNLWARPMQGKIEPVVLVRITDGNHHFRACESRQETAAD